MSLITKQDLIARTRISAQLQERQVNPFIEDAETYDLPTLLSGKLIADVLAVPVIAAAAYNPATAYLTGGYSIENKTYYKALSDTTGITPGTDAAIWEPDYVATLRYLHLPEFLIWSAYSRLLLEIGTTPTEAGLTVASDPEATYQQASDKRRAELMASAKSKAAYHRQRITEYLSESGLVTTLSCGGRTVRRSNIISAL